MRKRRLFGGLALAGAAILGVLVALDGDMGGMIHGRASAVSERHASLSPADLERVGPGLAYFALGDFSALDTDTLRVSAAPWVLTSTLLALQETGGDPATVSTHHVEAALRRSGFLYPSTIGNWPQSTLPPAQAGQPLGQNIGHARRLVPPMALTIGNLGCAACHAGVMYRADGRPDPSRAWLGTPNTSLNLGAYTRSLYRAMREQGVDDVRLWSAIDRLYPDLEARERMTLRFVVLPELRRRAIALEAAGADDLLPFNSGTPGATNGFDSLRRRLALIPPGERVEGSALNSIPDLGDRVMRTRLLNTGAYGVPGKPDPRPLARADVDEAHMHELAGIVAYFTVPSMGVTPEAAQSHIGDTEKILHWLRDYRPQPFPGATDQALAMRGRTLYAAACAGCHGTYDDSLEHPRLQTFPNWEGDVGTDRVRATQFTPQVASAVNESAYGRHLDVRVAPRYSAPPLTGLWSSAPYLHNGSVPSLWQLMNPDQRAIEFPVGGHALDFAQAGLALVCDAQRRCRYPDRYVPFSEPEMFDTRRPGLGNGGHEREFEHLDDEAKHALIEYLKRL
ncbi:hypothetical protein L3D22_07855 [Lysobacter soli]|uniref:cytochrome c n=1 Tax=Lysobacter TaxID=68 RepID=UPI00178C0B8E|nr:cytochrome c [Lysobacter soli]UTA55699.1 hypothetical protein L3D22_07855 [Lysobacter soli]